MPKKRPQKKVSVFYLESKYIYRFKGVERKVKNQFLSKTSYPESKKNVLSKKNSIFIPDMLQKSCLNF